MEFSLKFSAEQGMTKISHTEFSIYGITVYYSILHVIDWGTVKLKTHTDY